MNESADYTPADRMAGILTGPEISRQIERGGIEIDPTDGFYMNPVSWDLRLGSKVGMYATFMRKYLDSKRELEYEVEEMYNGELVIEPGHLYLLHTLECVTTDKFVPVIDGKSSIGRLGLVVHATAGYGDPGFDGQYTLEVATLAYPVKIYAGMRFCQIRFHTMVGARKLYRGNYTDEASMGPVKSASWKQFATAGK